MKTIKELLQEQVYFIIENTKCNFPDQEFTLSTVCEHTNQVQFLAVFEVLSPNNYKFFEQIDPGYIACPFSNGYDIAYNLTDHFKHTVEGQYISMLGKNNNVKMTITNSIVETEFV